MKISKGGWKRITTNDELLVEERKAYKRWWALHKRKERMGNSVRAVGKKRSKKTGGPIRYGSEYVFYHNTFKHEGGKLERVYKLKKERAENAGRAYSAYLNKCLQAIEKYGTKADRKRLNDLLEENIK